jgi:hypothetical protein
MTRFAAQPSPLKARRQQAPHRQAARRHRASVGHPPRCQHGNCGRENRARPGTEASTATVGGA